MTGNALEIFYSLIPVTDLSPAVTDEKVRDWLGERERASLASLRFEKRRLDWLSGRLALKQLLRKVAPAASDMRPDQLEILKAESGAPYLAPESGLGGSISISHSQGWVLAGYCPHGAAFGLDLERVEPRDPALAETFFTSDELAVISALSDHAQATAVTAIWSLKEAALKALATGLRADTRAIGIGLRAGESRYPGWQPAAIEHALAGQPQLYGWLTCRDGMILSAAAVNPGIQFVAVYAGR